MAKFKIEIHQGEIIPPWYGVAYEKIAQDIAVCVPVPFNVIVGWWVSISCWIRFGGARVYRNPRLAYQQGFNAGRAAK